MNLWYVTFGTDADNQKSYLVAAQDIYAAVTEGQALDSGTTRTSLAVRPGPGTVDNWSTVEARIEADWSASQPVVASVSTK